MSVILGIRREDKNRWERRVPIIPKHVQKLKKNYDIETIIQPSDIRIFSDKEYLYAGAKVQNNLSSSSVARTVSLPAAIAVKMILTNKIRLTGVQIPVVPELYNPILDELEKKGIKFIENSQKI